MMIPFLSSSPKSSSSPRMRTSQSPQGRLSPSNSRKVLHRDDSNILEKDKSRSSCTVNQACLLVAICSALAAGSTALLAASLFWNSYDLYSDHMVASTTRSVISRRRVRSLSSARMKEASDALARDIEPPKVVAATTSSSEVTPLPVIESTASNERKTKEVKFPLSTLPEPVNDPNSPRPYVAWLMSFPNSGTSFTLHMTREASNCTTATNYALEGDIRDEPSVQAIPGPAGVNGPWLELIRDRQTNVPPVILTKTHCKGICAGNDCGPHGGIETVRSFMIGCLSGVRAVKKDGKIVTQKVKYNPSIVKKAIHIFRHPLDNVVARFHLDYHDQTAAGNKKFAEVFPRNATGFRRWCSFDDRNKFFLKSRYTDVFVKQRMAGIPCMNEFYRYVQWHNLAFDTSRYMNLPTMMLHYNEYSDNLEATRDRILDWLELPHVGPGEPFHTGKVYRHYYSDEQRQAIRAFLKEFASAETWEQLKGYDFQLHPSSAVA